MLGRFVLVPGSVGNGSTALLARPRPQLATRRGPGDRGGDRQLGLVADAARQLPRHEQRLRRRRRGREPHRAAAGLHLHAEPRAELHPAGDDVGRAGAGHRRPRPRHDARAAGSADHRREPAEHGHHRRRRGRRRRRAGRHRGERRHGVPDRAGPPSLAGELHGRLDALRHARRDGDRPAVAGRPEPAPDHPHRAGRGRCPRRRARPAPLRARHPAPLGARGRRAAARAGPRLDQPTAARPERPRRRPAGRRLGRLPSGQGADPVRRRRRRSAIDHPVVVLGARRGRPGAARPRPRAGLRRAGPLRADRRRRPARPRPGVGGRGQRRGRPDGRRARSS